MGIEFGRDICCDQAKSEKLEWLVTNGIGGFASGTISGMLMRRYHGLLVAALDPPLGRNLLVAKLDETATYNGNDYPLSSNRWSVGTIDPRGYVNIERFYLDGAIPVWEYAVSDALIEKRVWMKQGENTTYVTYCLLRATSPVEISAKAYVNYRDYHGTTHAQGWEMGVEEVENGIRVTAYDGAVPYYVLTDTAEIELQNEWYYGFDLAQEDYRGLDHVEDHLLAATVSKVLKEGECFTVVGTLDDKPGVDGKTEHDSRKTYERQILDRLKIRGKEYSKEVAEDIDRLALAADQFIVDRSMPDDKDGKTIIAGYHWFGDWGRDTMISLPGLTISTGRPEVAASILRTFAKYVDKGMLPNRFPDSGEEPEYNTVDATFWFFEAVRRYFEVSKDARFLEELFPVLEGIIDWQIKGKRYNIKADSEDGLLYAGEQGVQLTWMDARVGGRVITPRIGKPVEVNALWYNALCSMSEFAKTLKKPSDKYESASSLALSGFSKFWNERLGYCYDVIDGPGGNDPSLRPNQILAVSLPNSPIEKDKQRKVVDICAEHLLTSHGLRSLSPDDKSYKGHYGGDQSSRDGAYHQGTVWGWLLGHFALAHLRVCNEPETALGFLKPMLGQLRSHGLGSLSEIYDGDAPMTPRGCIAQAWTVGETLRAWLEIRKLLEK